MAEPFQLPMFPDRATLICLRPERDEARFYQLEIWPDLFGRALLVRNWGRIGTKGRRGLDPHPDPGAAINALAAWPALGAAGATRTANVTSPPRAPGQKRGRCPCAPVRARRAGGLLGHG